MSLADKRMMKNLEESLGKMLIEPVYASIIGWKRGRPGASMRNSYRKWTMDKTMVSGSQRSKDKRSMSTL